MRADGELLPSAVVRNIGDKLYEKRKTAALEVEQVRHPTAAAGHPAGALVVVFVDALCRHDSCGLWPQCMHQCCSCGQVWSKQQLRMVSCSSSLKSRRGQGQSFPNISVPLIVLLSAV